MDIKHLKGIFQKISHHSKYSDVIFTVKDEMVSACSVALSNDRVTSLGAKFEGVEDIKFATNAHEALSGLKKFKEPVCIDFVGNSMFVKSIEGRKKSLEIPIKRDKVALSKIPSFIPALDGDKLSMGGNDITLDGAFIPDIKVMKSVIKDAMSNEKGGVLSITDGLVEYSVSDKLKERDEITSECVKDVNVKSTYTGLDELMKVLDGDVTVHFGNIQPIVFDESSEDIHTLYVIMPRQEF